MKKEDSALRALMIVLGLSVGAFPSCDTKEREPTVELSAEDTEVWRPQMRDSTIGYISMGIGARENKDAVYACYDVQGYHPDYTVRVMASVQKYTGDWQMVVISSRYNEHHCKDNMLAIIPAGTKARMVLDVTVLDASGKTVETLTVTSKAKTI